MFIFFRCTLITLITATLATVAHASEQDIVNAYAKMVSDSYTQSSVKAQELDQALRSFVQNPSEQTQAAAKTAWIDSRRVYSPTEVYRFYSGPIDSETGPEGLLNAWPLDEVYIDYVLGDADAGIINNIMMYPEITKEMLRELNEKDGEKNISTGYHAIEFLLWGQDFNAHGPGQRKYTDFVVGTGKNADRRAQYLLTVSEMLQEDLKTLVDAWDLSDSNSYGAQFVLPENTRESLKNIILGAYTLAAEELSQERIFVAYDTQQQEDEHSCFSDTTHLDLYYNYMGIQNVMNLFLNDLETKDATLKATVQTQMANLEQQTQAFPAPFDQAILDPAKRPAILLIVHNLEFLGEEISKVAEVYGVPLVQE